MLARQASVARSASAASLPRPGALAMPSSTGRPPPATTMSLQASTASVHRASPLSAAVACGGVLGSGSQQGMQPRLQFARQGPIVKRAEQAAAS